MSVCEEFTTGRDWLTSVQKVSAGSTVPDLTAATGRLYIFDSRTSDGNRAVYDLPASVQLPDGTALVGNGESDAKPRLLLGKSDGAGQMQTASAGKYLLADLEVRAQSSNQTAQNILYSDSPEHLELSGVTLSADYTPAGNSGVNLLYILNLNGNNTQANFTSRFDIHNCEFLVPEIESTTKTFYLVAVQLTALSQDNDDLASLKFANNRIVTRNYNAEPRHIQRKVAAMSMVGKVAIAAGSNCNSVESPAGQDLVMDNYATLFVSQAITPPHNDAIGFTNHHAWGWKLEQGVAQRVYDTWESWKNLGVNTQCDNPPGSDGDSSLAVKVAVPIVVFGIVATVTVVGLIVGYKKIPKKSWQQLRSMIERSLHRGSSSQEPYSYQKI
ncbi:MAG: hypothetical protein ACR2PT_22735 [Endozoicomonas sp.]